MVKIEKISVKNYKNIQADNLELSNFNIIVGPNNSGKSNFVQILSFLNFIINGPSNDVEIGFNRGFFGHFGRIIPDNINSLPGSTVIALEFVDSDNEVQYSYSIEIGWKFDESKNRKGEISEIVNEKFEYKNIHNTGPSKTIFKRVKSTVIFGDALKKTRILEKISGHLSVISLLKFILGELPNVFEYKKAINVFDFVLTTDTFFFSNLELSKTDDTKQIKTFAGRTISFDLHKEINKLFKDKSKWEIFKNALNQILKINDIEVIHFPITQRRKKTNSIKKYEDQIIIFFEHFENYKRLNDLSDGSILLIALITIIILSKHDIFIIEEPENSIHPRALVDLISFFRSFEDEKQFIINTHSITLINKVRPNDVIIAKCNETGISNLSNVSNEKEIKKKLKQSYIEFSDLIFFNDPEDNE